MNERDAYIAAFKTPNSGVNKLFLSRVGDVALDVPDANVLIQISSHYGSRLQEAQRMGRILRRGSSTNAISGNNAFFYTLISTDTLEIYFSNKRRRYLVDQGYAYKVIRADTKAWLDDAPGLDSSASCLDYLLKHSHFMSTKDEQLRVLSSVSFLCFISRFSAHEPQPQRRSLRAMPSMRKKQLKQHCIRIT